jgi:4-oxalocrotonate tautomerase
MPIVMVYMLEGRTEEQKKILMEKVTKAIEEALGVAPERVRVLIFDVPKKSFAIGGKTAEELGM